jgi:hypothetical protein
VVDGLLPMAQNSPSGTLIEAKCNNPGVVCFDGHEESTSEVVVLWLCPTVWNRLNEVQHQTQGSLTKLIGSSGEESSFTHGLTS